MQVLYSQKKSKRRNHFSIEIFSILAVLSFSQPFYSIAQQPDPKSAANLAPQQPTTPAQTNPLYTVESCNDGDTCRIKTTDNITIKVRLVGIDAPEFKGKKSKRQPMSEESKIFLNTLLKGKKVKLTSYGTDAFNRNLAELIVDDKIANLEMVKNGLAEVYRGRPPKGLNLETYEKAEKEAKDQKKGIWSLNNYQSPKDFRKQN